MLCPFVLLIERERIGTIEILCNPGNGRRAARRRRLDTGNGDYVGSSQFEPQVVRNGARGHGRARAVDADRT